jgi:hypothetical protein
MPALAVAIVSSSVFASARFFFYEKPEQVYLVLIPGLRCGNSESLIRLIG